jgi:UDP-N-acetylmuramate dehydrogenase
MNFANLRGEVKLNEPLAAHTSFRIGGPADALVYPVDRADLAALLHAIGAAKEQYIVVGGGTNLLVRDGGFRGVVISLQNFNGIRVTREYRSIGGVYAVIVAGAGAALAQLLNFSIDHGFTGMEFAAGIPGTVGGAICMNAGTARGEIGDVVDSVTMLSPEDGILLRSQDEMGFGYRTASVPAGHVVVEATFVLRQGDKSRSQARVREYMEYRMEQQPRGLPNAGSIFRNPLDDSAGKLIETAGLKGLTVGRARVSDKHANFIVNLGDATAADVLKLMDTIQERVLAVHNVRLEPEIKIIGEDRRGADHGPITASPK